jgi:tetratricopeptide (TPR) repeat protein
MSRGVLALAFLAALPVWAQNQPSGSQDTGAPELKRDRTPKANSGKEEIPPEEDTSLAKDDYSFNPLQSKRDVEVGDQYRKKGNWVAAARRYQTATWRNDGNTEAWLKLGEARRKLHDAKAAKEAYTKYLELDADSKTAQGVRKTLAKLK